MILKIVLSLFIFIFIPLTFAKDEKINQLELQDSLQRFYTRFTERVVESFLYLSETRTNKMNRLTMTEYLLYDSEALKIVTGPYPEINLLDMMVFIKLNRLLIEQYWIPKVWGPKGETLLSAFLNSEADINSIARNVMSNNEISKINKIILSWRKNHHEQFRVEKIRLDDFSKVVGKAIQQQQQEKGGFSLSNLIVDTRSAVKSVDHMELVANRGIFLAQYLPTLIRLQTRLGFNEIADDLALRLGNMDKSFAGIGNVPPMIDSISSLTKDLDVLTKDAKALIATYKKEFPTGIRATENLKEIHGVVDKSHVLLKEFKSVKGMDSDLFITLKKALWESLIYIAMVMVLVGTVLTVIFWTGFYVVKRKLGQGDI
jgi:hypothetical protein